MGKDLPSAKHLMQVFYILHRIYNMGKKIA